MIEAESFVPVLLLLLIADCFMIWQVICFNRKRLSGVQVITARFPILALIAGADQILHVTTIPMVRLIWGEEGDVPCQWGTTIDSLLVGIVAPISLCRMYLLVVKYHVQKQYTEKGGVYSDKDSEPSVSVGTQDSSTWLMEHQQLIKPPFLTAYIAFLCFCFTFPSLLSSASCQKLGSLALQRGIFVIPAAVGVIEAILMWKTKEAMGLKKELALTMGLAVGMIILKFIGLKMGRVGPIGVYEILMVLLHVGMFYTIIMFPQRFAKRQAQRVIRQTEAVSLQSFLDDRVAGAFESFQEYLEMEFAGENLLFWRDTSEYRKAPSLKKAFLIYRNYIIPFSIRQVNIPSKITTKIDDEMRTLCSKDPRFQARYNQLHRANKGRTGTLQLETVKTYTPSKGSRNLTLSKNSDDDVSNIEFDEHAELREVFAEAQISIFQLLEEGPWIRFLVSEQYEQWINEQAV